MATKKPTPKTPSERAAASRARRVQTSGVTPISMVPTPEAGAAIDRLRAAGYGATKAAVVNRAVIEAAFRSFAIHDAIRDGLEKAKAEADQIAGAITKSFKKINGKQAG